MVYVMKVMTTVYWTWCLDARGSRPCTLSGMRLLLHIKPTHLLIKRSHDQSPF